MIFSNSCSLQARDIMKNYQPSKLHNGGKMVLLFEILEASINIGDRLLVFSQSLSTLSLIEKFLADRPMPPLADPPADFDGKWARNKTYFREQKTLTFPHFTCFICPCFDILFIVTCMQLFLGSAEFLFLCSHFVPFKLKNTV